MTPERLLLLLTTLAVVVGFWLFNAHTLPLASSENTLRLRQQNTELTRINDELREQVANLQSMLADSPYPVPEPLIEFVQKDLALDFASAPPVVKLVGPDELRNAAERTLDLIHGPGGLENEDKIWHALGLLVQGEDLRSNWLTLVVYGEMGFYDLSEDTIFLPQETDLSDTRTQAALVRLIAQQRIARLRPEKSWPTLDAYRAWHAVTLGTAYDCEKRYLKRRSLTISDDKNSPAAQRDALLLQFSPAFQSLVNFPLLEGRERANEKYLESRAAFAEFLKNPPPTTYDLIVKKEPLTETQENPAKNSKHQNSLGALGLRMILDPAIGLEPSSELIQHWQKDHYELVAQSLVMKITLDDLTAAKTLAEAFQKIYETDLESLVTLKGKQIELKLQIPAP